MKCECYMPERCGIYGDIQVTVSDCETDVIHGCTRRRLVLKVHSLFTVNCVMIVNLPF